MRRLPLSVTLIAIGLSLGACTALPQPDLRADLQIEHPGCALLGTADWQSDPSTLYVQVEYTCGAASPSLETWKYQEEKGRWKRLRVIRQGVLTTPPGQKGITERL